MFVVIRENTFDPKKLVRGQAQLEEFAALHARQPGYKGNLVVDAGNGRAIAVTLWDSEEQGAAARAVVEPAAVRLLQPLLTVPSRLLGSGNVVSQDLVTE